MHNTGPFTQYNRAIAKRLEAPDRPYLPLNESLLGGFGAYESLFIKMLVDLADADRTTYA